MTAYQKLYIIITHSLEYLTLIGLRWHSLVRYFLICCRLLQCCLSVLSSGLLKQVLLSCLSYHTMDSLSLLSQLSIVMKCPYFTIIIPAIIEEIVAFYGVTQYSNALLLKETFPNTDLCSKLVLFCMNRPTHWINAWFSFNIFIKQIVKRKYKLYMHAIHD